MGLRRIIAQPVSGPGTADRMSDGTFVPSIELDDVTGEWWIGGSKISPPAAGALRRHLPSEGSIGGGNTLFVFSGAPSDQSSFFLVWNGMVMGPGDYSMVGETVNTNFTPSGTDSLFGLY